MGRPKKEIDEKQVLALARIQCTYEEMAAVLDCSKDTLKRRFAHVIQKGKEDGRASLRRSQFAAALKGSTTMQIWLGKQLLGQSEKITAVVKQPEGPADPAQKAAAEAAAEAALKAARSQARASRRNSGDPPSNA